MNDTEAHTASTTMRAIAVTAWGGPETLEEVTVPRPEPGVNEIRVAVHAAGVNPADWKSRASGGFGLWGDPPILGWDVSGVVDAIGRGSTLYTVGDEVFGMPRFPAQAGAYAEYVVAPARHFAPKPANLDHIQAASLPLVGLTAWQGLVEFAGVRPGQRALVHAAAGGLGHVALQLAKARGAHVIGTASAGKHALLYELGADELIDYTEGDFSATLRDVDVVFDTIGDGYAVRSLQTLRDGGTLVSLRGPDQPGAEVQAAAAKRGIRTGFTLVEPDRHGLIALSELVEAGRLRPLIAEVLPLAEAARAHELGETNRTTGKLVLQVR